MRSVLVALAAGLWTATLAAAQTVTTTLPASYHVHAARNHHEHRAHFHDRVVVGFHQPP
jgi:hypothetical protein